MLLSTETKRIQDALKDLLKKRGFSYSLLAQELGVSLPTMKRLLNGPDLSIERLARLCEVVGVDLHDLLEITRKPEADLHFFTLEQEKFFAKNPEYLLYFLALHAERKSPDEIEKAARISRRSTERYLSVLLEMGLIRLSEGRIAQSRVKGLTRWDERGPLGKSVSYRVIRRMTDRMVGDSAQDPFLEVSGRMLTPKEYAAMKADFQAVVAKYRRISKLNSSSKDISKMSRYEMVLMADRRPSRASEIPELAGPLAPAARAADRSEIRPTAEARP